MGDVNNTVTVLMAVFSFLIAADKVIDIVKKWKAPSTDVAKKLANDKIKLDEHDEAIRDLHQGQQVLCGGITALLDHELHNGNTGQMEAARDDLMKYLKEKL